MRVVIIGGNGQLGTDLVKVFSDFDLTPLSHRDLEICDFPRTRTRLSEHRPDVVINTAAYNRVDDCESEVERAFQVNASAVRNLAEICADLDCVLMHLSTDYVFAGDKRTPYTEDDVPNPLSVYGRSKLAGESFVRSLCSKHFVVRTSGLFGLEGSRQKGGNFVDTMIRLAIDGRPIRVVNDQILTPTYTKDLARKIKQLLLSESYGLYHITNGGECSWYQFAEKIFELLALKPDFRSARTAAYKQKARRPPYSVLAHSRLQRLGLDDMSSWSEALEDYLKEKNYPVSCRSSA